MFQWEGFNPQVGGTRVTGFPGLAAVAFLLTPELSSAVTPLTCYSCTEKM